MFPAFLLALREGIEAALIIGIILGTLNKVRHPEFRGKVWLGTLSAVIVSIITALILNVLGQSFEGKFEAVFEGITMLSAAGILTWMIFWMRRQANHIAVNIKEDISQAVHKGSGTALFALAFFAVVREGVELVLFLTAASFTTGVQGTLVGALLGLLSAVFLGWAIHKSLVRLNLRRFFQITGILLIVFAAGLVAYGVHEFNEAGWIPAVIEHVWDINPILDEKSPLGLILKTLLGYNGNPSLTEVVAYAGYLIALILLIRRWKVPVVSDAANTHKQKFQTQN